MIGRQFLRWEALAALVDGRHLEIILYAGLQVDFCVRCAHHNTIVIAFVAHSCVDHVGRGHG